MIKELPQRDLLLVYCRMSPNSHFRCLHLKDENESITHTLKRLITLRCALKINLEKAI